jgi:hypothetical protein
MGLHPVGDAPVACLVDLDSDVEVPRHGYGIAQA